jgi:hypothetical protein
MDRFNLVEGVMVQDPNGEYCLYSDVMSVDSVAANTLLAQLNAIVAQIEAWNG